LETIITPLPPAGGVGNYGDSALRNYGDSALRNYGDSALNYCTLENYENYGELR